MPTRVIATRRLGSPLDVWAAMPRPVSTTKRTVWVRLGDLPLDQRACRAGRSPSSRCRGPRRRGRTRAGRRSRGCGRGTPTRTRRRAARGPAGGRGWRACVFTRGQEAGHASVLTGVGRRATMASMTVSTRIWSATASKPGRSGAAARGGRSALTSSGMTWSRPASRARARAAWLNAMLRARAGAELDVARQVGRDVALGVPGDVDQADDVADDRRVEVDAPGQSCRPSTSSTRPRRGVSASLAEDAGVDPVEDLGLLRRRRGSRGRP